MAGNSIHSMVISSIRRGSSWALVLTLVTGRGPSGASRAQGLPALPCAAHTQALHTSGTRIAGREAAMRGYRA